LKNIYVNYFPFYTLKYIKPVWYYNLYSKKSDNIFLNYKKAHSDKKLVIKYDYSYISEDMQLWDAAFQAFSKGIIADKNEKLEFNETEISIHPPDLYRFIRKYYKNIWAYYICFFRIITLHNPIKELLSIYLTRKVERVNIFEKFYAYPDYLNFKSNIILDNKQVSIIIPTLNRYSILFDLLNDLEGQSYKNFEVIIIDQSDEFQPVFYQQFNIDINLIFQSEKMLWKARNRGIDEAKADLLLFLDDDSRIEKNWIYEHINCLDYFKADISAGVSVSESGAKVPLNYSFFHISNQLDTGNALIKKDVFRGCGLFDRQFEKQRMGDGEFGVRAYLNGFTSIANPNAKRIHSKYSSGGLREMGSWDAMRPNSFFKIRPIPSVLYFWRNYWGRTLTIINLCQTVPFSLCLYRLKGSTLGNVISIFIFILFFPIICFQVLLSWRKSTAMITKGPLIEKIK